MKMRRAAAALILAAAMVLQMGSVALAKGLTLSKPKTETSQQAEKKSDKKADKKSDKKTEEKKEAETEEKENYWVSQLSDTEKKVYDQLLAGLQEGKSSISITLGKTSAESRKALVNKVMLLIAEQHPEFYWMGNSQSVSWRLTSKESTMTLKPAYHTGYGQKEVKKKNASLDKLVDGLKEDLPKSDSAKAKYIYDWVLARSDYDWDEFNAFNRTGAPTKDDDYSVVGILLNKTGTCQGYAESFQYLCDQLGVECITVSGIGNYGNGNMDHAWNYVKVDGNWYLVDTTWGDTFTGGKDKFALLGSESLVKPGVTVAKAYTPEKNGYFTYPELSKKAYSAK